jgi:hypothetical protein
MHVTCGEEQKVTCSDCFGGKLPCASLAGKGKLVLAHAMVTYRVGGGGYRYSFTEGSGVSRNFVRGVQQIQLRTEGRENGVWGR